MTEDELSYGISFDSNNSSPICTRIGSAVLHQTLPIQSLYRGCIVKDGELQYYLDPDDWSKKSAKGIDAGSGGITAGSSGVTPPTSSTEDAILDGTDGDVCVETPTFYIKCTTSGTVTTVRESLTQIDSSYKEVPAMFVDAYRTVIKDSKAYSVVNKTTAYRGGTNSTAYDSSTDQFRTLLGKPRTNISKANYRTYARNNGKELMSYDQYKAIFYWNYVIEYANFNCQAAFNSELTDEGYHQGGLGNGLTTWDWTSWGNYNGNNPITPCGYGNSLGNGTGVKDIAIPATTVNSTTTVAAKTLQMNRWRGFDNPFGDIWTNLDGVVFNNPNMYIICNPDNYTDSVTNIQADRTYSAMPTSYGFTKSMQLGEYADCIPKTVGGSNSTYMCDYYYTNTGVNTLLVGGNADYGLSSGFGYFDSYSGVGHAWADIGARCVRLIA